VRVRPPTTDQLPRRPRFQKCWRAAPRLLPRPSLAVRGARGPLAPLRRRLRPYPCGTDGPSPSPSPRHAWHAKARVHCPRGGHARAPRLPASPHRISPTGTPPPLPDRREFPFDFAAHAPTIPHSLPRSHRVTNGGEAESARYRCLPRLASPKKRYACSYVRSLPVLDEMPLRERAADRP
jgi:hypothetical protein